jgi:hypothetical protein
MNKIKKITMNKNTTINKEKEMNSKYEKIKN